MKTKICIDCNIKDSVERRRCIECLKIHNRVRAKKYHKKDKPRYGIIKCSICNQDMIKNRPDQTYHGKCRIPYKSKVDNYNNVPRSNKANTLARQIIIDLGFRLTKNLVIHHIDENPNNNVLSNFWIVNVKNHSKLHAFLRRKWSSLGKLNDSNLENCWNSLRGQLTTTWLETTGVKVIKIIDIGQSAAEPLNEDCIYIFSNEEGSETMYQVPETGNAVGKDIVQTQTTNVGL